MPSKILAALSPAYGAIKGVGPFSRTSALGAEQAYKNKNKIDDEERERVKSEELAKRIDLTGGSSYNDIIMKKMSVGGRTKPIDGCAVKGKTKSPVF